MWAAVVVMGLLVMLLGVLWLVADIPPRTCARDWRRPMDWIVFHAPRLTYSDRLVNVWVPQSWRTDGQRIPCRLERADPQGSPTSSLIVYSHGNAEDLLAAWPFLKECSAALHCDMLTWDYSGYGLHPHDPAERTAEGINRSWSAVVEYVVRTLGYDPRRLVLWGYSLGTGPTVEGAAHLCRQGSPPAGVILFGAYTSIRALVEDHTSSTWLSQWFDERWSSIDHIRDITCPVLLVHGQRDGLISPRHSQRLKDACPHAELVTIPHTGHTTLAWSEGLAQVQAWWARTQT